MTLKCIKSFDSDFGPEVGKFYEPIFEIANGCPGCGGTLYEFEQFAHWLWCSRHFSKMEDFIEMSTMTVDELLDVSVVEII